ncbi:hypothetical protein SprV_0902744100 [Sparganum proliferum]
MFNHLQCCLPEEYAEELCDFLVHHPLEQPYDKLKEALVRRVGMTEERRLRQLLTAKELGDQKPLQLLRGVRKLVGKRKFKASILRQLFLQRLPLDVLTVLAVSQGSIEELAELADKFMTLRVADTHSVSRTAIPTSQGYDQRIDGLEQMTAQLSAVAARDPRGSPDRRRSSSRPRTRREQSSNNMCWHHQQFGEADFVIDHNGKADTVSIDGVKPTYVEDSEPISPQQSTQLQAVTPPPPTGGDPPSTRSTRSGRHVAD